VTRTSLQILTLVRRKKKDGSHQAEWIGLDVATSVEDGDEASNEDGDTRPDDSSSNDETDDIESNNDDEEGNEARFEGLF
jgi:hypothetical protein